MFELLFSQTAQKDAQYFKRLGYKTIIAKIQDHQQIINN